MKFGDDWTGAFLRGDDAVPLGMALKGLLERLPKAGSFDEVVERSLLRGLVQTLTSAHEHDGDKERRQVLKPFEDCLP